MSNTLFIFDWDDTLFPTTYITSNFRDLYSVNFNSLDVFLYNFFSFLIRYGDILIVTNANKKWIDILLYFLPNTKNILSKYNIISARDQATTKNYNDWKTEIFLKNINYINKYNIIFNVGDSECEHIALKKLLVKLNNKKTISYKFITNPSYLQLIVELYKFKIYVNNYFK